MDANVPVTGTGVDTELALLRLENERLRRALSALTEVGPIPDEDPHPEHINQSHASMDPGGPIIIPADGDALAARGLSHAGARVTGDDGIDDMSWSVRSALPMHAIDRGARQIILGEIGISGQKSIIDGSVLVIGAGGLGAPALLYLSACGIGRIGISDFDVVDVSNLHRQVIHRERAVGRPKVWSAVAECRARNRHTQYEVWEVPFSAANGIRMVSSYDVVIDATDNVRTRYGINDACVLAGKPLVSGSALRIEGQLTVYGVAGGPCYRCIQPTPPPLSSVTNCDQSGVLGPVPGVIGVLQAIEAIKVLLLKGQRPPTDKPGADRSSFPPPELLAGRFFTFNAWTFTTRIARLRPRSLTCAVCGDHPTITTLIDCYADSGADAQVCSSAGHQLGAVPPTSTAAPSLLSAVESVLSTRVPVPILSTDEQISCSEFSLLLKPLYNACTRGPKSAAGAAPDDEEDSVRSSLTPSNRRLADLRQRLEFLERLSVSKDSTDPTPIFLLLDVRPAAEYSVSSIPTSCNVPLAELPVALDIIQATTVPKYVYCRRGNASRRAAQFLRLSGVSDVFNIIGGVTEWKSSVNPLFPVV